MKQIWDYIIIKRMVRSFSDGKGAFCNGNESDDGYNDDRNYNETNEQQQLS